MGRRCASYQSFEIQFRRACWNVFTETGLFRQSGGIPMTSLKTLATIAMLSAATTSPVFAAGQEGGGPIGPGSSNGLTPQPGPMFHGFSESLFSPYMSHRDAINSMARKDRSRVGGRAN
jgi:hypothetical protein